MIFLDRFVATFEYFLFPSLYVVTGEISEGMRIAFRLVSLETRMIETKSKFEI